ncbi:MAG: hypothetical protein JO166_23940 [Deltaproteobacteria bacterium]|nr:hypothetical protein [Deltaproteobacteria bacterium]
MAWKAAILRLSLRAVKSSKSTRAALAARPDHSNARLLRVQDRFGVAPLAIYTLSSLVFLGRAVTPDLSSNYIGASNDPSVYMWLLRWWPHAIVYRLNPIITDAVWAPGGFNLAWTTPMPLPALVAAPLTRALGPIVVYNVLCILAPAIAAWSCFLLCRQIRADYLASGVGGYVFGFSPYMLAEVRGHLPLVLAFPVPVVAFLVFRRLEERISRSAFSVLLAAVLLVAFLCWAELYATMTFFGAVAFGVALFSADVAIRDRIRQLLFPILTAYAISLIAVVPYLYYFLQPGYPHSPINSPKKYSADLLNLLLPTEVNAMGNIGFIRAVAQHFTGNLLETGSYFSLPLTAIAIWFAWERRREATTRMLVAFLAIVCVLMLGPRLHVNGIELFGMPWKLMLHLPLLQHALPVRFSVYAFLALAMMVSMWLSMSRSAVVKIAAVLLLAIFLCPNLHAAFWTRRNDTPSFFSSRDQQRYLKPAENVVILPYGITGTSMLWQATADFYFRMAGGWTSITPLEFQMWPIVSAMLTQTYIPDITSQLRAFMAAHDARAIIVDDRVVQFWAPMLSPLDATPLRIGGVVLYRPPSSKKSVYQPPTALEAEQRNDLARFSVLLLAASRYLAQRREPAILTPIEAQRLGLLPPHWVTDPDVRTNNGLYLGPWNRNEVALGVVGTYLGLQPVVQKYRAAAAEILLPFPRRLSESRRGDTFMLLVMVFDHNGLARAVRTATPVHY